MVYDEQASWDERRYQYFSRPYAPRPTTDNGQMAGSGDVYGKDLSTVLAATDPWTSPLHQGYSSPVAEGKRTLSTYRPALSTAYPQSKAPSPSYFGGDPLANFLYGKQRFLNWSAKDIVGLVYDRQQLHREQTDGIEQQKMSINSSLLSLTEWHVGANPAIDRRRDSLESQVQSLERERRTQEVAAWRDTTRLRADLREILGELAAEERKWSLLGGYEGSR